MSTTLGYQRAGAGDPLLLIHGLGADRYCWRPVVAQLVSHFEMIVPDLPGFGSSAPLKAGDPPQPSRLAEVLIDFLHEHGVQSPHLAGCSLGAWIALEMAALGEGRTVTAICPAGLWETPPLAESERPAPSGRTLARMARPLLHAVAGTERGREALLSHAIAHAGRLDAGDARQLLDAWLSAPAYGEARMWMRRGRFSGWDRIGVPVTLAWGERDRLVEVPERIPAATHSVALAGCGHLAMWDDAGLVADTIYDTAARGEPPVPRFGD